jgi:hypothetical protein
MSKITIYSLNQRWRVAKVVAATHALHSLPQTDAQQTTMVLLEISHVNGAFLCETSTTTLVDDVTR